MKNPKTILLTGATGYVGGKLLKRLEFGQHQVNCLVRSPDKLKSCAGTSRVFKGDVMQAETMRPAFEGAEVAYYMVHSLADKKGAFEQHELEAAHNFVNEARSAGVQRIIYLGGLGNDNDQLSAHLRSRHAVGRVLRESGIPTLEFRASIVLGAGSLSFEMVRSLTEHLPFMVMPKWVSVKAQPIGIGDLLDYLVQALDVPLEQSEVVEVGGADQVSYRDLMVEYARQRHLKRLMIPVPVLTPWLSSHWLGLVTPLYATVGRKLIEGVRNPTVVESALAQKLFPIRPACAAEAMRQAIDELKSEEQRAA